MATRITDLEEYTPVINERLAGSELAIESLQDKLAEQVNKPSADVQQFKDEMAKLSLAQLNLQNSQLSMTRVKLLVEDEQQALADQINRLKLKVTSIDEKADRAFSLKAEIENKSKELDTVVDKKLATARADMLKNSERIEDGVRDRV